MRLFIKSIAEPISRRIGTMASGFLVAQGVAAETVAVIETGLIAAVLVGIDIALSNSNKRKLRGDR